MFILVLVTEIFILIRIYHDILEEILDNNRCETIIQLCVYDIQFSFIINGRTDMDITRMWYMLNFHRDEGNTGQDKVLFSYINHNYLLSQRSTVRIVSKFVSI